MGQCHNKTGQQRSFKTPIINRYLTIYSGRYNDIKQDIAEELEGLREEGATLENVSSNLDNKCRENLDKVDKISVLSSDHLKGFTLTYYG